MPSKEKARPSPCQTIKTIPTDGHVSLYLSDLKGEGPAASLRGRNPQVPGREGITRICSSRRLKRCTTEKRLCPRGLNWISSLPDVNEMITEALWAEGWEGGGAPSRGGQRTLREKDCGGQPETGRCHPQPPPNLPDTWLRHRCGNAAAMALACCAKWQSGAWGLAYVCLQLPRESHCPLSPSCSSGKCRLGKCPFNSQHWGPAWEGPPMELPDAPVSSRVKGAQPWHPLQRPCPRDHKTPDTQGLAHSRGNRDD